ncbi:MAG: NnrS family protein [Sulfurospirillaceae bacterium]|nr:NnrS family protein [Sulfurospirillaceae bacterium]
MKKFTITPPTPPLKEGTKGYFLSQVHQPFFVFGIVWAVVSMVVFGVAYKGVLPLHVSPSHFHTYSLIFIVFSHFFHGFLLTVFSKFCAGEAVKKEFYIPIFYMYQVGSFFVTCGVIFSIYLFLAGVVILLFAQTRVVYKLFEMHRYGKATLKKDPFWILIANSFGLSSHALFVYGFLMDANQQNVAWYEVAWSNAFWMHSIFLAFVVAQRMIPFFSHSLAQKNSMFLPLVFILFSLKTIAISLDISFLKMSIDVILAIFLLKEILRWKLSPFSSPAILWVLHLALFWLPAGLLIGSFESYMQRSFLYLGEHLVALGFLTTVLVGFGTRVALGHSKQAPHADRYAVFLFVLTQVVLLSRAMYSMAIGYDLKMLWLFDASMTFWVLLFVLWGLRYAPVLINGKKIS